MRYVSTFYTRPRIRGLLHIS